MHFCEQMLKMTFKWGLGGLIILTVCRSKPPLAGKH